MAPGGTAIFFVVNNANATIEPLILAQDLQTRFICGGVIRDDEFKVLEGLIEDRADGDGKPLPIVIMRGNNADFGFHRNKTTKRGYFELALKAIPKNDLAV